MLTFLQMVVGCGLIVVLHMLHILLKTNQTRTYNQIKEIPYSQYN